MIIPKLVAIPKFISHPLLLLAAGLAVGALVWNRLPDPQDIPQKQPTDYAATISNTKDTAQISNFSTDGCVSLKNYPDILCFDQGVVLPLDANPDFEKRFDTLKSFLVGKWIRTQGIENKKLTLPLDLWDESCFTNASKPARPELCPMRLYP